VGRTNSDYVRGLSGNLNEKGDVYLGVNNWGAFIKSITVCGIQEASRLCWVMDTAVAGICEVERPIREARLHHTANEWAAIRDSDIRVPDIEKVACALEVLHAGMNDSTVLLRRYTISQYLLLIRRLSKGFGDLRNREIVEGMLKRARNLLGIRPTSIEHILRDVSKLLPEICLSTLQVPIGRLDLSVGE
jgi:hypothetical protein